MTPARSTDTVRRMCGLGRNEQWLQWAVELQSIAQAGLYYGKDVFDREWYERVREIAAEMIARQTELPTEKVKELFCCETGYQTPKLDTRAAIFRDGKILLVKEKNGTWFLPGGWADVGLSLMENTIKEVREEAGLWRSSRTGSSRYRTGKSTIGRFTPIRSVKFFRCVPSLAGIFSPTMRR